MAGHSGQFTPGGLPVNTVIHTTSVGLEPATVVTRLTVVLHFLSSVQTVCSRLGVLTRHGPIASVSFGV